MCSNDASSNLLALRQELKNNMNTKQKIIIPEISDKELVKRLGKIKFLRPAMAGLDGKPYETQEQDEKYFDLFYVESNADPRTQAFNFDDKSIMTSKATGIAELLTKDIFVAIGGYYGFCKITMAEVLSQIPEDIVDQVVAFALNPKVDIQIINDDFQSVSIIFYGKTDQPIVDEALPSSEGLMRCVNYEKANLLKNRIRPMIHYVGEGNSAIEPGNIDEPFMRIGIWLKVNGSNLHETNQETKITEGYKLGEKISVYQPFTTGADFYHPTYAYTISQIPDELINGNTIGFLYQTTDYFKTSEGVIHKTEYILVEKT